MHMIMRSPRLPAHSIHAASQITSAPSSSHHTIMSCPIAQVSQLVHAGILQHLDWDADACKIVFNALRLCLVVVSETSPVTGQSFLPPMANIFVKHAAKRAVNEMLQCLASALGKAGLHSGDISDAGEDACNDSFGSGQCCLYKGAAVPLPTSRSSLVRFHSTSSPKRGSSYVDIIVGAEASFYKRCLFVSDMVVHGHLRRLRMKRVVA